ncbi:MAG: hypothetical protein QXI37_03300 [Thermoprotei archaeon]
MSYSPPVSKIPEGVFTNWVTVFDEVVDTVNQASQIGPGNLSISEIDFVAYMNDFGNSRTMAINLDGSNYSVIVPPPGNNVFSSNDFSYSTYEKYVVYLDLFSPSSITVFRGGKSLFTYTFNNMATSNNNYPSAVISPSGKYIVAFGGDASNVNVARVHIFWGTP